MSVQKCIQLWKQEELELPAKNQSSNITAGTEMWWDRWHDWSTPMDSS